MSTVQTTNEAQSYRGPTGAARFGYIAAIIVNVILWVLAHHRQLLEWGLPVITEDWPRILWAVRLSLGGSIVVHILYLLYDARWFRRLGEIVTGSLALLSMYVTFTVFPFALPNNLLEQVLRLGLLAGMVGLSITIIVHVGHLLNTRSAE